MNSPVTGEFPAQSPVTRGFDVFFDLHCNKWLSKRSWGRWFETPSHPSWCYSKAIHNKKKISLSASVDQNNWCHVVSMSYSELTDPLVFPILVKINIIRLSTWHRYFTTIYKSIREFTVWLILITIAVAWPNGLSNDHKGSSSVSV